MDLHPAWRGPKSSTARIPQTSGKGARDGVELMSKHADIRTTCVYASYPPELLLTSQTSACSTTSGTLRVLVSDVCTWASADMPVSAP